MQRLGLGMALLLAATVRCSSEEDSSGESLTGNTVDFKSLLIGPEPQTISLGTTKRGATVVFPAGVTRSQTPITVNLNDGVKKRGATVGGPVVEIVTAALAFETPGKMRQPLPAPPVGKSYVAVSAQRSDGTWAIKRGGVRVVAVDGAGGRTGTGGSAVDPGAGGTVPVGGTVGNGGMPGDEDAGVALGGRGAGGTAAGGTAGGGGVAADGSAGGGGVAADGGAGGGAGAAGGAAAGGGGVAADGGAGGVDAGVPVGGIAGGGGAADDGGSGGGAGTPAGGTMGSAGSSGGTSVGGTAGTSQSTFTQLATEEILITYEIDILGTGYWGIALEDDGTGTGATVP